jgi:hypothetical protein
LRDSLGAVKVAKELPQAAKSFKAVPQIKLGKRSFLSERFDLQTDQFVDFVFDAIAHGKAAPGLLSIASDTAPGPFPAVSP